ncbi:DUF6701 domain-containing protein [Aeromonas simiae]|uniref:DUF6701 domain-containing protein n=1 Tax=Aeromonas simiae TaxID=218936 RepID=UPI00266D5ED9|nr:DUF6701 domain-containing protein [Aeromonas simiae]MDO2947626.1 hypothetical protein [Aeromonas simiae]MDO2953038.1 hypothetical protein [Aeromonas simiae]MDO2954841.1 hypothetical protein [Aeromonas simiae]
MSKILLPLFAVIGAWSAQVDAATINCDSIFPGPAQSHNGEQGNDRGSLRMLNGAVIENYNKSDLCFKNTREEHEMANNACGTAGKCISIGQISQPMEKPTIFKTTSKDGTKTLESTSFTIGGSTGYGNVHAGDKKRWDAGSFEVRRGSVMNLSDAYDTYVLGVVGVADGGVINFKAGKTYHLKNFWMNPNSTANIVGDGPTWIYIGGGQSDNESSFRLGRDSHVKITGGTTLGVYVSGEFELLEGSTVEGAYYVNQSAKLENRSVLTGQLSAAKVEMSDSKIIYRPGIPELPKATVDHFELTHSGQGLTCNPEEVSIKACANADCSALITDKVTATLTRQYATSSNGWLLGNGTLGDLTLNFEQGYASARLRNNTPGMITMGVKESQPAMKGATLCRIGDGVPSKDACSLHFDDSGFIVDIPDGIANQELTGSIKAVKADSNLRCVPGFQNETKELHLWSAYVEPADNRFGSKITLNGKTLPGAKESTQSLFFGNDGEAAIKVRYADAGKMKIEASYQGKGEESGLVMKGSGLFVSAPQGLCLEVSKGACHRPDGDYANCSVLAKTGESFSIALRAVAWEREGDDDICSGNLPTPNFELANIALGSEVVAPVSGVDATLRFDSYQHVRTDAKNTNTLEQWVDEVGVFRLTATPPKYFDQSIPVARSAPIGRFVPAHFALRSGGVVAPNNADFTYMGQPFNSHFVVQAQNQHGIATRNYRDGFAKGKPFIVAGDGVDRSSRIDMMPFSADELAPWHEGTLEAKQEELNTRFARTPQPENPLTLAIGILVDDRDGARSKLLDLNMNPAVNGVCVTNCTARQLGEQEMLYGRLNAGTEQGGVREPLAVKQTVEFYEGGWKTSTRDNTTQLALSDLVFTGDNQSVNTEGSSLTFQKGDVTGSIKIGVGKSGPGGVSSVVEGGVTNLHLGAPGQALRVPYRVNVEHQPWLDDPDSLDGVAVFGSSAGNDRILYSRERFE